MDTERCKKLVSMIQQLESTEIEELFKMLHANGCKYTSNNHGVFMNLSWLSEDILLKIETYVAFCHRSKTEVYKYESLCDVFNKNIQENPKKKNNVTVSDAAISAETTNATHETSSNEKKASKVSSSMKFYLLKKRYAKQLVPGGLTKNDLEIEP